MRSGRVKSYRIHKTVSEITKFAVACAIFLVVCGVFLNFAVLSAARKLD